MSDERVERWREVLHYAIPDTDEVSATFTHPVAREALTAYRAKCQIALARYMAAREVESRPASQSTDCKCGCEEIKSSAGYHCPNCGHRELGTLE